MMGLFDFSGDHGWPPRPAVGLTARPGHCAKETPARLASSGTPGGVARPYFRCYLQTGCRTDEPLAPIKRRRPEAGEAVYQCGSIRASYFHAWFGSSPGATASFVERNLLKVTPGRERFNFPRVPQRILHGRRDHRVVVLGRRRALWAFRAPRATPAGA